MSFIESQVIREDFYVEKVIYVPLDERPCNYKFPLLLAEQTDLHVIVPPRSILGQKKQPADAGRVLQWLHKESVSATRLIVSLDMLIYGGIVPSRLHHQSQDECLQRLHALKTIKDNNPQLKIYAYNLIMRVPAYDSDDEEPDYYAEYGRQLFRYGWLDDKSERESLTEEETDEFVTLRQTIPGPVLTDFVGRRKVNACINRQAVQLTAEGIIDLLIIPLDDNSKYGFTAKEQRELLFLAEELNLLDRVFIYPGADEIGCTLLARVFCETKTYRPEVFVRYSSTQGPFIVPRYEDRSLNESVKSHLTAAGAFIGDSSGEAQFVLMVNSPPVGQSDAAETSLAFRERHRAYFSEMHLYEFVSAIRTYINKGKLVALADVATSNGADHALMKLLAKSDCLKQLAAYAGWNTSGNTLGTVIAHAIIESYYVHSEKSDDAVRLKKSREFFIYRLLEDWGYQSLVRKEIISDVLPALGLETNRLDSSEAEICSRIEQRLNEFKSAYLKELSSHQINISNVRLPWHRMFEVDFEINLQ
jgi:hypothetical protein